MIAAAFIEDGEGIDLDGQVSEAVWRRAAPATGFLQQDPVEGAPASERTEVYVAHDGDNLYIGAVLWDSEPDGILGYQKARDAGLGTDDRFMWILDTFLDGRTGYFFEINPAGLMGDGLLSGGTHSVNKSWDGIWEARVARGDGGWSAEIRIPFRTLNFDPSQDTWGINFQRTVRRKNEEALWSGHQRNQGIFRPVHAGRLTGLGQASQGIGLEVTPYATGGWQNILGNARPTEYPGDVGVDLTYSVTPSLRAALSVNTDFAEVEVDQRRVNLTRFPLRFPEQRDFFLEGSGVFSFVPENGVEPYFSRRIGLVGGEQIPIVYGARLGGQAGAYELGFLQVRTGEEGEVPAEDFTIARVKRSMFRQSYIGMLYTRRATHPFSDGTVLPDRHTLGVDLDLFTSTFLGDKNLGFQAFFVGHTDPEPDGVSSPADDGAFNPGPDGASTPAPDGASKLGDLSARGVRLNFPNDTWQAHVSYRELGDRFEPAVGFTRRNGFRRVQPTVNWSPRPEGISAIRRFSFEYELEYLTDLSNRLLTRRTQVKLLGIDFESGDSLAFSGIRWFERLDDPFAIHPGVVIPVGDYDDLEWTLNVRTAGRRVVSGNVNLRAGDFYSGDWVQVNLGLDVKPVPGLTLSLDLQRSEAWMRFGDFTTQVLRLEGGWQMSPWMAFLGNLQYDDVSEVVGLFSRYRWTLRPGSDLFVVYTHNWRNLGDGLRDLRLQTLSRGAATKINYTHRF